MAHSYSQQNVPSYMAAGEAHYHELLANAAEARRFVPERTCHAVGAKSVGATLCRATSTALIRLGTWRRASTVPAAISEIRWPPQSIR